MTAAIITEGIKISVFTQFQDMYSNAYQNSFAFSYKIRIENTSENTVQLLRRHWYIYNGNGTMTEVEGEGVIGQQPIIEPGQFHEYISGCNLPTPIGKMNGNYLMERLIDGKNFFVDIPQMDLIVPHLMN
jgi:ApaG protein